MTDPPVQVLIEAINDQAILAQARLPRDLSGPEHEALKSALGVAMQAAARAAVELELLNHRRYRVEGTVVPSLEARAGNPDDRAKDRAGHRDLNATGGFIALEITGDDALHPALIASAIVAIQLSLNTACDEGFNVDVGIELASPSQVLALTKQIASEVLSDQG